MSKNKDNQKETLTESSIRKAKVNRYDEIPDNEIEKVNQALNEKFYPSNKKHHSSPAAYLNNNTAAIDVTENEESER
ncbi:hypothetical protein [Radiobacillus deserti]|uniref:Uncharacterized protein n=1 Tax=Radiobacillus deserti TaxID=2594883 RepID=A0A516KC58_9BACI|nr:hypothetical protein [Radiobacillus deserti]QDP38991.1 hypothetical protein FN924_01425 [Radiobacillus deserti]